MTWICRTITIAARVGLGGALLLTGCTTAVRPRADLLAQVARDSGPFDHGALQRVLEHHVDADGRVTYAELAADRDDLELAYARVAASSPRRHPDRFPTDADRLAYWINAYNTAVLRCVVDHYPIGSVQDVHGPWFFDPPGAGFFYFLRPVFGGESIDLKSLEDDVIRAGFDEPRIHFALNCASAGCPRLPAEPFRPATLDAQLERETRRFFAEPRNLRRDPDTGTVHLSVLLDWYRDDFVGWLRTHRPDLPADLCEYVALHAPPELAGHLRATPRPALRFDAYDWSLNDRRPPARR